MKGKASMSNPDIEKFAAHCKRLAAGDTSWNNLGKVAQAVNTTRRSKQVQAVLAKLPDCGDVKGVLHATRRTMASVLGVDPKAFEASRPDAKTPDYLK